MAGLSGAGGPTGIPGTNVPPVSFPGIVSGIDYNSIIQKLTSLTLAPVTQIDAQISTLNAANAELLKINALLASVQNALTALSDPALFSTYEPTLSSTAFATAAGLPSVSATPGTYIVDSATLATATQVTSASNTGHTENDLIGGVSASNVPLINSYAAITPSNGASGQGSITVDGVKINYDVTTQSLNTILANINSAVHASGDATFNIGFVGSSDTVQVTDSAHPVALGSSSDSGNLLAVLRLDQAQVSNTATSGTVTGTAGVGGVNAALSFGSANSANFVTPVTAGVFTINGVQINVSSTENTYDVINSINSSAAGVVASYNTANGKITLTSKSTGPQSIVLGAPSDSSNFLQAAGLTTASGASVSLGSQASVTYQTQGGSPQTVYSNSNTVTNAIPGIGLTLTANDAGTPFTVTVAQSSTNLVSAINTFVSAYNAAISEINTATAAPVVVQSSTGGGPNASQSVGGGVLYGNADVQGIKNQIVQIASNLFSGNGGSYNSLSSIGLNLSSSFQQAAASGNTSNGGSPITAQTINGTDGTFQALDVNKLQAALAANPIAVENLFNGGSSFISQIGSYLTTVTGISTITNGGLIGTPPATSLLQGFESTIQSQVSNLQTQVTQIQNNANQQADALRQEFVASESTLAGYQALQQQLGSFFGNGSGH